MHPPEHRRIHSVRVSCDPEIESLVIFANNNGSSRIFQRHRSEFAESDCNIFLANSQSDLDLGDDLEDDLGDEEIPEGFLAAAETEEDPNIPSGAVPKKTPITVSQVIQLSG